MKIGCLGAARIAPPALVYPAQVRGDAVLQAVAARDAARAKAFAERYGFAEALPDYAALVAHPEIELIYNPLPINLHAAWTIRALEAGKHVLCEKPFAMNSAEAAAMLDAAKANKRRLIEAFHYRYHPAFATLLDWLREGRIGRLKSIEAVFNVAIGDDGGAEIRHLVETGGGAFMDLGCYPLSWTLHVMNAAPEHVEAEAELTKRGVDETMRAELSFAGGVTAKLSASMAAEHAFKAELALTGEAGTLVLRNPVQPHRGGALVLTRDGKTEITPADRLSTYTYQLCAVLDALAADGPPLPTEGDAILRQQQTLDAVYAAAGLRHLRYRD